MKRPGYKMSLYGKSPETRSKDVAQCGMVTCNEIMPENIFVRFSGAYYKIFKKELDYLGYVNGLTY